MFSASTQKGCQGFTFLPHSVSGNAQFAPGIGWNEPTGKEIFQLWQTIQAAAAWAPSTASPGRCTIAACPASIPNITGIFPIITGPVPPANARKAAAAAAAAESTAVIPAQAAETAQIAQATTAAAAVTPGAPPACSPPMRR